MGKAERPVNPTGDLRQLQAIHQRLFQDVYEWAGQLRTVDMRKGNDPAAEFFMPVSRLQFGAGYAFQELAEDNYLRGLDKDRFVSRLAHHYDQVNYLHPFREGNGRSQRILWTQVAREAGYELDWGGATGKVNDQASRDAMEKQDLSGLRAPGSVRCSTRSRHLPRAVAPPTCRPNGCGCSPTSTYRRAPAMRGRRRQRRRRSRAAPRTVVATQE
jgi:fido (protein-threonine AMPylation protein)